MFKRTYNPAEWASSDSRAQADVSGGINYNRFHVKRNTQIPKRFNHAFSEMKRVTPLGGSSFRRRQSVDETDPATVSQPGLKRIDSSTYIKQYLTKTLEHDGMPQSKLPPFEFQNKLPANNFNIHINSSRTLDKPRGTSGCTSHHSESFSPAKQVQKSVSHTSHILSSEPPGEALETVSLQPLQRQGDNKLNEGLTIDQLVESAYEVSGDFRALDQSTIKELSGIGRRFLSER